jgi:hypothetical protein
MNCQNPHTNTLPKQTHIATHALPEPAYEHLDKPNIRAIHELSEPTYEKLCKPTIQIHTGELAPSEATT